MTTRSSPAAPRTTPRFAVAGLFAGGFLGPFGGGVVASVLPELGHSFGVSAGAASASLTVYLLPFAALMLVSGTLGQRWGARRSVVVAYLVYVVASLLCALPVPFTVFLGMRALQGIANAFTTPLLLAAVATVTPRERLGRALGLFAALQSAGQASAPLLGGLAAEASWRWAFVGVAVVAAVLAVIGLPEGTGQPPQRAAWASSLLSAWRPTVLRIGVVGFVGWGCLGGLSFLVALRAGDAFGVGAATRGMLLTSFGIAGLVTAHLVGRGVDRFGARRCVVVGATAGALLVALTGVLPWLVAVGVLWALAGIACQFLLVGLNALVLSGEGANRGGAVSVVQALRFLGGAASPVAFVPLYHLQPAVSFLVPAGLLAVTAPVALAHWHRGDGQARQRAAA